MEFIVEQEKSKALVVRVEADGDDVDLIVTLPNGTEYTIGYLNGEGLTLCELSPVDGLDQNSAGYIKHQYDN